MPKYQLLNPYIEGDLEKLYNGKNPLDAAEKLWSNLSTHITNNLPKFAFTMERVSDGKLFHFLIKEDVKGGLVDFSIENVDIKLKKKEVDQLKQKVSELQTRQEGGGRRKKSKKRSKKVEEESSSSSSSDYYNKALHNPDQQPIVYWWYTPWLYETTVGSVFVPTFTYPIVPYIELSNLSSALFPTVIW